MEIISPITKSNDITLLKTIAVDQLTELWKKNLSIDISKEFKDNTEIYLYQCNQTKLKFFHPPQIGGSGELYAKLAQFDWYYMPYKWEHEKAIEDLQGCHRILEVGCGRGDFVDKLNKIYNKNASGIEFNSQAVAEAQSQGINVSPTNLHQLAAQNPEYFDAVCTFQVLEHITDTYNFLNSLINLIKPQGKLILSVPNSDSFIKHDSQDILNQPPHHMSQWSLETFQKLTNLFPVKVDRFEHEPLADYHVDWFVEISKLRQFKKVNNNLLISFFIRAYYKLFRFLLHRLSFLRNMIKGHTIYICFEKVHR